MIDQIFRSVGPKVRNIHVFIYLLEVGDGFLIMVYDQSSRFCVIYFTISVQPVVYETFIYFPTKIVHNLICKGPEITEAIHQAADTQSSGET